VIGSNGQRMDREHAVTDSNGQRKGCNSNGKRTDGEQAMTNSK